MDSGEADGGCGVDLRLWGKVGELTKPYPLVFHLLDTGAAVEVLWRDVLPGSVTGAVARGLGRSVTETGRLLAFWAALHDVGKATPGFQEKVPGAFPGLAEYGTDGSRRDFRHEHGSQVWLGRVLGELGYPSRRMRRDSAFHVAQVLGGHHGVFCGLDKVEFSPRNRLPQLGGPRWEAQRRAVLDAVREVFDPPDPPAALSVEARVLACALVVLADWLVSQEDFLAKRLASAEFSATPAVLSEHREVTARLASGLVEDAGLGRAVLRSGGFEGEFPGSVADHVMAGSLI